MGTFFLGFACGFFFIGLLAFSAVIGVAIGKSNPKNTDQQ